jgi:hypothetical protein
MSAFCDPATTTSIPHASWRSSAAPMPETASTTSRRSWRRTTSAMARTSWTTPVEVSLWVAKTTSMPASSVSRRSISAGSSRAPHGGA